MKFEFENDKLFENVVTSYGLNLFLGAGFSVYSYNEEGESLPLGNKIKEKICETFSIEKKEKDNLGKVCRRIKSSHADYFKDYLRKTYRVKSYNEIYNVLPNLPIKNIISINIDDLIEKIYEEESSIRDISDVKLNGDTQKDNIVSLYKIHGSVTYPIEYPLSFTIEEINELFVRDPSLFSAVAYKMSLCPCIFWGTSLADGNTINLLAQKNRFNKKMYPSWIVVYPEDPDYEELCEDYREQGFSIITADTKDLLKYLSEMKFIDSSSKNKYVYKKYRDTFPNNFVCNELEKKSLVRPIGDFFHGQEPQISDVLSSSIIRTSYFGTISNIILKSQVTLITGIPGCGKSTILLQLAFAKEQKGRKFWFSNMLPTEAEKLVKLVSNDDNVTVFFDNLYSNLDSYKILSKSKIRIVVAERSLNYEYVKNYLNISADSIIDISDLNESDVQNICTSMKKSSIEPLELMKRSQSISLLELVFFAFHSKTVKDRIKEYVNTLTNFRDSHLKINLIELYTLVNYMSFCRVPTTIDVIYLYFAEKIDDYKDIYYALEKLNSIIIDVTDRYHENDLQDYLMTRSKVFADLSLKYISQNTLKQVLVHFHQCINYSLVYRFDIFTKKAYDADITTRAFRNTNEGIDFYNSVISIYQNPYVLHQFALYLQRNNNIDYAWKVIDQAYTEINKNAFTIANTHAIIMFEKNILITTSNDAEINNLKSILNKSFKTLEDCIAKDAKVNYHILIYARHTLRYIRKFGIDSYSEKYIFFALQKIDEVLSSKDYIYKKLYSEILSQKRELETIKNSMKK